MKIVDRKNNKIALKIGIDDIKDGLSFFSEDKDFLQVGSWRYEEGTKLKAHIHNTVPREVTRTQEFVFVVKGSLKASLYDDDEIFIEDVIVKEQEALVLFAGAHGYEILEDDSIILEVKNGPYPGAEIDRRRIEKE